MKKKLISLFLSLALIFTFCPLNAFAADGNAVALSTDGVSFTEYSTFADGWNAAIASGNITVKLLQSVVADSAKSFGSGEGFIDGGIFVPAGKSIALDLNGFTVNRNNDYTVTAAGSVITVGGSLCVTDTSAENSGQIRGGWGLNQAGGVAVTDGAYFKLDGGTVVDNLTEAAVGAGITLGTSAELVIGDGGSVIENRAKKSDGYRFSNVRLLAGQCVKIAESLSKKTTVGVDGTDFEGVEIKGAEGYTPTRDDIGMFVPDREGCSVWYDTVSQTGRVADKLFLVETNGTRTLYSDLGEAFAYAVSNNSPSASVTLLNNYIVDKDSCNLILPEGKTLTFDLNGYAISGPVDRVGVEYLIENGNLFTVNGTLTLTNTDKDTSRIGGFVNTGDGGLALIGESGTFNVNAPRGDIGIWFNGSGGKGSVICNYGKTSLSGNITTLFNTSYDLETCGAIYQGGELTLNGELNFYLNMGVDGWSENDIFLSEGKLINIGEGGLVGDAGILLFTERNSLRLCPIDLTNETDTDYSEFFGYAAGGFTCVDSEEGGKHRLRLVASDDWLTKDSAGNYLYVDFGIFAEAKDEYFIDNAAQLAAVAALTNAYDPSAAAQVTLSDGTSSATATNFDGKRLVITKDLDLGNYRWTPIGSSESSAFSGTLSSVDDDTAVTGLYYAGAGQRGGLFGYIGENGCVEKTNLFNSELVADVEIGSATLGGIAAVNEGTIRSSTVSGVITFMGSGKFGSVTAGGIVGTNLGTVDQGRDYIALTVNNGSVASVGGVVGANMGTIKNAEVLGKMTVSGGFVTLGGIVGMNLGTVRNSSNGSELSADGSETAFIMLGGIAGANTYIIENCFNTARLDSESEGHLMLGGIVGENLGEVYSCYTKRAFTDREITQCAGIANGVDKGYFGNIVGMNPTPETDTEYTNAIAGCGVFEEADNQLLSFFDELGTPSEEYDGLCSTDGGTLLPAALNLWVEQQHEHYTFWSANAYLFGKYPESDRYTEKVEVIDSYAATSGTGIYARYDTVTIDAGTRSGYTFAGWTVTAGDAVLDRPYSAVTVFSVPSTYVSVTANWIEDVYYSIEAGCGENGTISPSGTVSVLSGESPSFDIAAKVGYEIADVTVDGVSVGARSTYWFSNVNENHTIYATFKAIGDTDAKTDAEKIAENAGGTYKLDMSEKGEIPAEIFKAAKESGTDLILDYGTYSWTIKASDIGEPKALDLSITKINSIPEDALSGLEGDSIQLEIAFDGELDLTAVLNLELGEKLAGKSVSVYHFNEETEKLELIGSFEINENGYAEIPFTHCSRYVLNIFEPIKADSDDEEIEETEDSEEPTESEAVPEEEADEEQPADTGDDSETDTEAAPADTDKADGESAAETEDEDENPPTGVAFAFPIILMSAAAVSVTVGKKKRK